MTPKKVILITGCAKGLGLALAQEASLAGYAVVATVRDKKDCLLVERSIDQCNKKSDRLVLALDVTNELQIDGVVAHVNQTYGHIDILIHNAGAFLLGPPDTASPSQADYIFRTNVTGPLLLTQKVLPIMRKQKSGKIIFISSISGVESSAYMGVYCASKYAIEGLVDSWAPLLPQWGIEISLVEPGAINSSLPNNPVIGEFYPSDANPYGSFSQHAALFLKEVLSSVGKEPRAVAKQIIEICNSNQPQLRYQTCDFSRSLVNRHIRDPQKKEWISEHRALIKDWLRGSTANEN